MRFAVIDRGDREKCAQNTPLCNPQEYMSKSFSFSHAIFMNPS